MTLLKDINQDDGFSLSELIVVLGLIGFVLAAIYGATYAMMRAGGQSEAQSTFARESGEPVRIISKALMQTIVIETADPYVVAVRIDKKMDALEQRIRVSTGTSGKLVFEEWQLDGARQVVSTRPPIVFSTHCSNVSRSLPLFRYYDAAGNEITDLEAVSSDARSIQMSLALRYEDSDFVSQQWIYLRNRY